MQSIKNFFSYLWRIPRRYKIAGVVALAVIIIAVHIATRPPAAAPAAADETHVVLASVASLSNQGGPLPVVGQVTSVSEASISALSGGQITSLPHKLGDRVAAGAVLASFENSSQQAAVLQAQGQYDSALASQRAVSPTDARTTAINAYTSAFSTLDSLLTTDVDVFFGNPGPYGPQLTISAPMYDLGELSRDRKNIDDEVEAYRAELASAERADPAALLAHAISVVSDTAGFINKLAVAVTDRDLHATDDQIAAITSARSGIATLAATLASAQQAYRSGSVSTTASTDASVTIALGGLRAAQAALEKTYVRAPISGTIVSLPVNRGDFISPGTLVAAISNPTALQIEAYVTAADAKTLRVGGKASIEGASVGTIVFVAPALDPTTGKIQVKVGLAGGSQTLADGSTVAVMLEREAQSTGASGALTIPIAAVKITPQGSQVFTVASSTLVAHEVTLGSVVGGQVAVTAGLTPDMDIVSDARGLSEGQVVAVDAQ
jgi:RND family efflux transporter MFP subunit